MIYVYIVVKVNDTGTPIPRIVAESEARIVWAKRYQAAFPLERQGCYADHTIGTDFLWVVKVGDDDADDDADDDTDSDRDIFNWMVTGMVTGVFDRDGDRDSFNWREARYVNE